MGTTSKALSLLSFFSRARASIGLSDMARLSGMNKATAHRLLSELADQGFVEQTGTGREYRLGPAVLRLAALRENTVPMRDMAMQVLTDLSAATGETAHMSVLSGDVLSSIAYTYAHAHGTMVMMEDAEVLTLHATGSGLAVLAFSDPGFVDQALARPLAARTRHTETDPAAIRALLPGIRARGFATSVGGFEEDVHSHAAPVFDAQSRCIGAVAVAAPVSRMTNALRDSIQAELLTRTTHLTRLLGGFLPSTFPTFEPQVTLQKGA
ncbi:IclR family transcriptional regulator [Aliiroseovarius subalbicans]|uniref:IclR family transcriptional regulator n=1 Tax=Aliiroseovarius subalbicans TaxID=2925840 RepID=UPI001F593399|nr:IclR family transcriptional regulator [Aliiroseovarius subalbicans]MCI2397834.1 IclR family transcriptional regulator [Aliiroseovarius subalbicans]